MLDYLKSYWTLRWTQQPQYHPLPPNITRTYTKTPAGDIELLISEPTTLDPTATPIFFVHGGNGHASVWLEWMTHLSQTYHARTYAYSLRNHGASFSVPYLRMVWLTSLDDLAADLTHSLAHATCLENGTAPIIVAHSSGGGLAQYILSNSLTRARGLVLVGAVPHFGNVQVYSNWFTRIDRWFMLRNFAHFCHPNSGLNTDSLVHNAFFGSAFPRSRVPEFRSWMANYECMWWPYSMGGTGWNIRKMRWLDPLAILKSVVRWKGGDKVAVMIGTEDFMMGGTEERMAAEFREAIWRLRREKKVDDDGGDAGGGPLEGKGTVVAQAVDRYVTEETHGGVRLVRVEGAGHHTQNDVQWREACEALRRFAEQV
jgi:pimeloyl-ACP methyl ester carboxylesterase